MTSTAASPVARLRQAAAMLSAFRARPCLVLVGDLERSALPGLVTAMRRSDAEAIDLLVSSNGGDVEAAYLMARTIRRRARIDTAFVPLLAKSAATLVCLAAGEIVLGELGELGPLDGQSSAGSALAPFELVEQVSDAVAQGIERARRVAPKALSAPNGEAAGVAGAIVRALVSPIEPLRLADAARSLDEVRGFCERIFRRYRPELDDGGAAIVRRLVHGYPCHGMPIDLEELFDLGLPARGPEPGEGVMLDDAADAIRALPDDFRRIEVVSAVPPRAAAAPVPSRRRKTG